MPNTAPLLVTTCTHLAKELCIPLIEIDNYPHWTTQQTNTYLLHRLEGALSLIPCGKGAPGPIQVDFGSNAHAHRRLYGGGQGQMIAKACGVAKGKKPSIADLTAGLGRDAFVLASLGCAVQLIERSPLIYHLLYDGIARGSCHADIGSIIQRMTLHSTNALNWLEQQQAKAEDLRPQIIYLDPMFPHRDKTALVKKEMLIFRALLGDDPDADTLLEPALAIATARVVVKRPRKAPYLANQKPSFSLEGKSSRFDVYALKKLQ